MAESQPSVQVSDIANAVDDDAAWAAWLAPWAFANTPALLTTARLNILRLPKDLVPPAVVRLNGLGQEATDRERGAWDRVRYRQDAQADAKVAEMWTRWAQGQPFADQARWQKLLGKPVRQSFRQALSNRPLPPHVVTRALADLEEALFYQLIGSAEGPSGFAELAVTLLETGPGGPVRSLFRVLSDRERAIVATCVSRRGHWPDTISHALPELAGSNERSLHLRQHVGPEEAEGWLDLHVVMRLVRTWEEAGELDPAGDRDRSILVQNRGRARGRLRAVAARRTPLNLLPPVLELEHLADRTRAAARRWAWSWAWEALATGFAFDLGQSVLRPCAVDNAGPEPLEAEELEMVRVWAMLAALRGRWGTLVRWCRTGEGDPDGTWGRLLGEIPTDLRDPDGGLSRVRSALATDVSGLMESLSDPLKEISGLTEGRSLKQRFWEVVDPVWHDGIRRPRSGFPTMRRNAEAWVRASESDLRVPGDPRGAPSS